MQWWEPGMLEEEQYIVTAKNKQNNQEQKQANKQTSKRKKQTNVNVSLQYTSDDDR